MGKRDAKLDKLDRRHLTAIALLVEGQTSHDDVATAAQVSTSTLSRWKHDKLFMRELDEQLHVYRDDVLDINLAGARHRLVEAENDHTSLADQMTGDKASQAASARSRIRTEVREEVADLERRLLAARARLEPYEDVRALPEMVMSDTIPLCERVRHFCRELELDPLTPVEEVCVRFEEEQL